MTDRSGQSVAVHPAAAPAPGSEAVGPVMRQLQQALDAGNLDDAAQLAPRLAPLAPPDLLTRLADLLLNHARPHAAVQLLEHSPHARLPALALRLRLARNLHALAIHRPEILALLSAVQPTGRYRQTVLPAGQTSLIDTAARPRPLCLSPGMDPDAALRRTLGELAPATQTLAPVALAGVGDGHLLAHLARHPPAAFMDKAQLVYLLEPDLELFLAVLALHDFHQPSGPFADPRFHFCLGPRWHDRYHHLLRDDPMLRSPEVCVPLPPARPEIALQLDAVQHRLNDDEHALAARIDHHYAALDDRTLALRLAGHADRPPRALFLTTRFSTVLQYAVRDTAHAFQALGFQTHVLIEPTNRHDVTPRAVRRHLDQFQPDLVFQIDHLRHEHPGLFPPNLPFVCWIQDPLPNLNNRAAGAAVTRRDFVLTFMGPSYIQTHGYPAAQVIDMPIMLTRPPETDGDTRGNPTPQAGPSSSGPAPLTPAAPDLVYVSNVSATPRAIIDQTRPTLPPVVRKLFDHLTQAILDVYHHGGNIPTQYDLRQLLLRTAQSHGYVIGSPADIDQIVNLAWNPLNTALYRQQALRWVADAARSLGLTLALFGRGWHDHPDFAPFARGPVQHGPDLQHLTRSARINLNLEPYPCFAHHRLLDGLTAGGFFLVRHHPLNTVLPELHNFLRQHLDHPGKNGRSAGSGPDPAIASHPPDTTRAARAALHPDLLPAFDDLIRRAACASFTDPPDPVRQLRCFQRAAVLIDQPHALPHLDDISFNDHATCRSLIQRFIADPDARQAISHAQRLNIESRLTFTAGMRRVLDAIARRLREHADHPQSLRHAG